LIEVPAIVERTELTQTASAPNCLAESLAPFAGISGLDVEFGLAQAHNNMAMYVRMLNVFARVHGQDAGRIVEALAANDLVGVKKIAHALKGSAAMIGIKGVSLAAASLHTACQEALALDEIRLRCEALATVLTSFKESIRRVSGEFE
jgi:two-component system, sensor histidine kinase and response regulator